MKSINVERIHGLDALRAIMMLLGIVLHAGLTYASGNYSTFWSLKSPQNSLFFDIVVAYIHFFRMPVFFVVSGYFGALLFYKKGPEQMLRNRINRIFLPFIAGVLMVYPMSIFAFAYTNSALAGEIVPLKKAWNEIIIGKFFPYNVLHLWFLYFLIFYSFGGWLLAKIFKNDTGLSICFNKTLTYILQNFWLRIITLTSLFFLCLYWIGEPYLTTNNKWSIDLPIFMTYFMFFELGWVIFKTNSLNKMKDYPFGQLAVATFLFFAFLFTPWGDSAWTIYAKEFLSALFCTIFIFGFIALFMTYFNTNSPKLDYVMGATYWVYLIHLPIVAFLPGLFSDFAISPFLKFFITLLITIILCFISYHFLVRKTFIGRFLNGKIHKFKKNVTLESVKEQ